MRYRRLLGLRIPSIAAPGSPNPGFMFRNSPGVGSVHTRKIEFSITRLNFPEVAPGALKTMLDIEGYLSKCGLERSLLHLIKMRMSQINGCASRHALEGRAGRR